MTLGLTILFRAYYLLIQTIRSTLKDQDRSVTFRVYPRMEQREKFRLFMAVSSGRSPPFQACNSLFSTKVENLSKYSTQLDALRCSWDAIEKTHYIRDHTNRNRTNWGIPVHSKVLQCALAPTVPPSLISKPVACLKWRTPATWHGHNQTDLLSLRHSWIYSESYAPLSVFRSWAVGLDK